MADLLTELLSARATFSSHRNRRALFSRFDEIFSHRAQEAEAFQPLLGSADIGTRMKCVFRRIALENWKAFEQAELILPRGGDAKPVTLIGGHNGHGKTSILEGVILCLYGVQSFLDGGRGSGGETTEIARRSEYHRFVERALHQPAFDRGSRMSMVSVQVLVEQEPFEVERRWYFDDDGRLYEDDEELVIRAGADRNIVPVPAGEDPTSFYEGLIAATIAPASMVPFFLFDGERVSELARRDLGEQVRFGIESALGISASKRLVSDLQDYIKDRGRDLLENELGALLFKEVADLEVARTAAFESLTALDDKIEPLRRERDNIVQRMAGLNGGSYHDRHVLLETRHSAQLQLSALRAEIATAASRLLPSIVVSSSLCKATVEALKNTMRLAAVEQPLSQGHLTRLLEVLGRTEPRLDARNEALVEERLRRAWDEANSPLPMSESDPHAYLVGHRIGRVVEVLEQHPQDARPVLEELLARADGLKAVISSSQAALSAQDDVEADKETISASLQSLNRRLQALEADRRQDEQRVWKIDVELEPKRQELLRRQGLRRGQSTGLAAVDAAGLVRSALIASIESSIPRHYGQLAERVTEIYQQLAHKSIVGRIDIDESGRVSIYDQAGRDLRQTDASAGESQIFAMSLIAAISNLLGAPLPIIVDTPLGRLDPGHRERILDFFKSRPGQTVLLSQPEEVGGRYYDQIAPALAAEFHLSYERERGGLGHTVLELGYFPPRAA